MRARQTTPSQPPPPDLLQTNITPREATRQPSVRYQAEDLTPVGMHNTIRSKLPIHTTVTWKSQTVGRRREPVVAHNLRDSGYTFYRESMLVLGQSRRYVQAHTCARTQKHPCTHPRTHADAYTPTSHQPKHAHTRAHAPKRAHTRPRTPRWSALTSNASMEVDHPAVATMLVASSGTVLPAPIIPFRGRFWAQCARERRASHRFTAARKSGVRRARPNAQIRNQAKWRQARPPTLRSLTPLIFSSCDG